MSADSAPQGAALRPGDLDLLTQLAPLFDDSEAASMLGAMLVQSASTMFQAPTAGTAVQEEPRDRIEQRVALWRHLASVQERLGENEGRCRLLRSGPQRGRPPRTTVTVELRRAALAVVEGRSPERARSHLRALLQSTPLDRSLLIRLQSLEETSENPALAARIAQVVRLLELSPSGPLIRVVAGTSLALPGIPVRSSSMRPIMRAGPCPKLACCPMSSPRCGMASSA